MHSLTHNLITVRRFGCVIVENFINRLYEKCLSIIYNDKRSSYKQLLSKDVSVSMNHKNLQKCITKVCKIVDGLCPESMEKVFQFQTQNHHNLRSSKVKKVYRTLV